MKTLASYNYESWMCTECGLRNPMLDPMCSECGECQPSVVRRAKKPVRSSQSGTGRQRAEQIQNNIQYNNMQMVFEPELEEEIAPVVVQRERSPMENSLLFGANLITWVCLWIISLVALFITTICVLGMYKAFS